MRSQGGLPMTASKPGALPVKAVGKVVHQCKKRSRCANSRTVFSSVLACATAAPLPSSMRPAASVATRFRCGDSSTVRAARRLSSPSLASLAGLSTGQPGTSQRMARQKSSRACSGATSASASSASVLDRRAWAMSTSVKSATWCRFLAARSRRSSSPCWNSIPKLCKPRCTAPNCSPCSESPCFRWWSRKLSGAPTVKVCSHSAVLASSTAIRFLSTPNTLFFNTMRRTMWRSSSCASVTRQPCCWAWALMVRRMCAARPTTGLCQGRPDSIQWATPCSSDTACAARVCASSTASARWSTSATRKCPLPMAGSQTFNSRMLLAGSAAFNSSSSLAPSACLRPSRLSSASNSACFSCTSRPTLSRRISRTRSSCV